MLQIAPEKLADLERAYRATHYDVFDGQSTVQIRVNAVSAPLDQLLAKYQCGIWAFITAHNPYSQPVDDLKNQTRHQELIAEVEGLGTPFLKAVGRDPTGQWPPEESLLIMGIDRECAIAIGKKYNQNAILYGEHGAPAQLLWLVEPSSPSASCSSH